MSVKHIPTLRPGIALVLAGPPGCGKSTLARELAEQRGAHAELDVEYIGPHFHIATFLQRGSPRTIIIEGAPRTEHQLAVIKQIANTTVHGDRAELGRSYQPAVIICAQDENTLPGEFFEVRHFDVFLMPVVV